MGAVKCFNEDFSVGVSVSASKNKKKMFCKVDAVKEDAKMNVKDAGLDVYFFRWDANGENLRIYESEVKYTNKKGFKINVPDGDKPDCYGCSVYMGERYEYSVNTDACLESIRDDSEEEDYDSKDGRISHFRKALNQ